MAATVTVVASGGLPVSEATNGTPLTPADNAVPVTIITDGGMPVTFISVDGILWPGGVAPGSGSPSLDFSDPANSQYLGPII